MLKNRFLSTGLVLLVAVLAGFRAEPPDSSRTAAVVLDDFEHDTTGDWPTQWRFLSSEDQAFHPLDDFMNERERFYVVQEQGNKFLRAFTHDEAQRISLPRERMGWKLSSHPRLAWRWRARHLPRGAREDRVNDTGGAVYVSFSKTDWLGRPLSIKYSYSTSLPVGTVVSTGNVKVIVASSGANGTGRWVGVERDVVKDYRLVFGEAPPDAPFTVTIWSDSDDTGTVAEVDFDDLRLLPKRP